VLSCYTVLPWESADEYQAIVSALVAEHAPRGPTEEHLVEEIAGIMRRKRRLRLAEAAAHRPGLNGTLASSRETVKVALVHLDTTGQSERAVDAIRATAEDTEDDMADVAADGCSNRWRKVGHDDVGAELNEHSRDLAGALAAPPGITELKREISAFRIAERLQATLEGVGADAVETRTRTRQLAVIFHVAERAH
jgi:hypothetical protein